MISTSSNIVGECVTVGEYVPGRKSGGIYSIKGVGEIVMMVGDAVSSVGTLVGPVVGGFVGTGVGLIVGDRVGV